MILRQTCIKKLSLAMIGVALLGCQKNNSGTSKVLVALTQIVEHPSLDLERQGLLSVLKESGYEEGKNLELIYQNAQGNLVTATQIATRLVGLEPSVLVAISTPSAQAAVASRGKAKIPLVFTAVSDPSGAKLTQSGVTGVSDSLPAESQLGLVKKFIPKIKNLGVIYNAGEANSVAAVRDLKKQADLEKITLVSAIAIRSSEVLSAAQSLVGKVEAIYVPNDNTAVSSIEIVLQVGTQNRIPIFAGDIGSVMKGAVAMAGYNRTELGREAGRKVVQILNGMDPEQIPITQTHAIEITVNPKAAEKMGVQVPLNLPENTQIVGENQ